MKKLRKVKTNLQDSIEAYEGACDCAPNCNCHCNCACSNVNPTVTSRTNTGYTTAANTQEFVGVSTSLSSVHWS